MTATGARPKGPNKPDSRMTQDCTYNNDIMAVNKPHAANEAVEIAQTLNCTLTNSVDYFDNRDVGPLFLSYNTLKSHFAYFRGRNADGSQISKMLRADYTEDEGYVTMDDMANPFDCDQDRYISKAISQSTKIIHQTAAYASDFVFNTVTIVCYMVNKQMNRKRKV